ncbi:MAG: Ig-like domain-containing protein [bacterium]|nr:Ig-like domain-containing protein [bacterium]
MTERKSMILLAWLAVLALALGACSESSTTPEDDDTDTTAPLVAGTSPSAGHINVAPDATIIVTFSEPIAQASLASQVTISPGGAGAADWQTERQVSIAHTSAWAQGAQVTVTLGTGITDLAGNHLAAPHAFSFFVQTNELLLLGSEPAAGATGVSRSANIRLQFSRPVDMASLSNHTTVSDPVSKAVYPYTASVGANNWYTLDPTASLPAGATLVVTVGAAVAASGDPSTTLGETAAFQFTTGVEVDTTPPTIVSFSPASGSLNVPRDVGLLVITFSEPIDPDTFDPVSWNVEFALVVMNQGTDPVWSEGNTVLTVALPELPVGLEMEAAFSGFADASGNVQTGIHEWEAKVAGTADIFPMVGNQWQYWYGPWSRGVAGNPAPTEHGENYEYRRFEVQGNGDVHVVEYASDTFVDPRRWDTYDRLAASIEWLGFADSGDGGTPDPITFDSTLKFLPLPMVAGSWTDNTTVNVPGEGSYTATLTGQVFPREDLPLDMRKAAPPSVGYYYKGAWKVVRSMDVELGGQWFTTLTDTTWYSPTLGPVHEITHEDFAERDSEPAGWYRTEMWRSPDAGVEGLK